MEDLRGDVSQVEVDHEDDEEGWRAQFTLLTPSLKRKNKFNNIMKFMFICFENLPFVVEWSIQGGHTLVLLH